MYRARVLPTAALVLVAQSLTLAPAAAFEFIEIDPESVQIRVETQDVEQTRVEGADGTSVVGGQLGAQPGCAGVQAYVKKLRGDGSQEWALSAAADKDCDLDGQPDGGGEPMFENMTSLDADYILSSTVHEAIYAPDGSVYFTGQLLVAWDAGGVLTAAWGAFVIHERAAGGHLADVYVGPQPTGAPVELSDCVALCMALEATSLTQWGGRALAWAAESANPSAGLVLAGWRWSSADQGATDKDVFFSILDPGLQTARWFSIFPYFGADLPLDVVISDAGDVYATGYYGEERDVFVARFAGPDGTLTHLFVGGGVLDDWGDELTITAGGEIEVEGTFTDSATFGTQVLSGDGPTDFRALLTPTLDLILAEVVEDGESLAADPRKDLAHQPTQPPTLPPSQPDGTQGNVPTRVDVLVGFAGSGTDPALVSTLNNEYLVLYGQTEPDHDKVDVVFEVPIAPGASILDEVKLAFISSACTDVTVRIGGGDADPGTYFEIGNAPVCPLEKTVLGFEIPGDVAEQELGFSASAQSPAPLQVLLSMAVYGSPPAGCSGQICASSPDDDESVDELMINSEFP
jgi:hypothetical protein